MSNLSRLNAIFLYKKGIKSYKEFKLKGKDLLINAELSNLYNARREPKNLEFINGKKLPNVGIYYPMNVYQSIFERLRDTNGFKYRNDIFTTVDTKEREQAYRIISLLIADCSLRLLSVLEREMLILRYIYLYSYDYICFYLSISKYKVVNMLSRALDKIANKVYHIYYREEGYSFNWKSSNIDIYQRVCYEPGGELFTYPGFNELANKYIDLIKEDSVKYNPKKLVTVLHDLFSNKSIYYTFKGEEGDKYVSYGFYTKKSYLNYINEKK